MAIIVSEVGRILTLICRSGVTGDTHGSIETHPSPLGESEGIHFRHGHRERKASLSDGVAVDRIAAVDQQEEFKEVTEELNKEIQEHRHEANV